MISRTSISALALVVASAGSAAAFPATATSDLNVRSGPGTAFSVVDTLRAGDTVEVTSSRGGWYQLASGGWASGGYLNAEGGAIEQGAIQQGYAAEPGYTVVQDYPPAYGPPAFYVGTDPYYWDDAGYYWYWRDGARHPVSHDYWRGRDYRDLRFTDARHRVDFETRIGGFEGRASSYGAPPPYVEPYGAPPVYRDRDDDDRILPRLFD